MQVMKSFHLPFKLSVYVLIVAMHVLILVRQLLISNKKLDKLSASFCNVLYMVTLNIILHYL